ncbi:MAG TPA: GNAT family N-acetyltransferase [Anaerolineales bacterium]|nr:GNAT family N-acetyltransferase [Anaerolineales bacterium]
MKYTVRPYQSKTDLYQIGKLIRRASKKREYFNAWSFCRFDIWSQRRIADTESFHDPCWQEYFHLLQDDTGTLVGATFGFDNHHWHKNPEPYAIILDPEHPELAETLFEWSEAAGMCEVEIMQGNVFLTDLLQSRGYTVSNDFMVARAKSLVNTPHEIVNLPAGYCIRNLERSDWASYFQAVHAVFNMMDTPEAFASIQQAPSNVHELHLNVLNDQNQIAAFCSVWLDRENNIAEFEPVGTVPQFQKQGLGAALLAHACNRLREMDCPQVNVESWSESIGANKLYSACGLIEQDRLYSWKKS